MHYMALKVEFLEDVTLQMTFQDGKVVRYDMSQMFEKYPQLEELRRNRKLFESGHLDLTGFAVIWNDELDFDATSIYDDGEVVGCVETTLNQQIGLPVSAGVFCGRRDSSSRRRSRPIRPGPWACGRWSSSGPCPASARTA